MDDDVKAPRQCGRRILVAPSWSDEMARFMAREEATREALEAGNLLVAGSVAWCWGRDHRTLVVTWNEDPA